MVTTSAPRGSSRSASVRPTTAEAAGLERRQEALAVPDRTLERLVALTPRSPVFMDRSLGGRLVRRWSLIVPEDLLDAAAGDVA
jgi:hypothetical protein